MSAQLTAAIGLALVLLLILVVLGMLHRRSVAYREEAASLEFSGPMAGFFANDDSPLGPEEDWISSSAGESSYAGNESAPQTELAEEQGSVEENGESEEPANVRFLPESRADSRGNGLPGPLAVSDSGSLPSASSPSVEYMPPTTIAADAVAALIGSLVDGQGELSQTELRRLELFRPERVLEAAAGWSDKVAGRGKESKRARLEKICRHAETLSSSEKEGITHLGSEPDSPGAEAQSEFWPQPPHDQSDAVETQAEQDRPEWAALPEPPAALSSDAWPAPDASPETELWSQDVDQAAELELWEPAPTPTEVEVWDSPVVAEDASAAVPTADEAWAGSDSLPAADTSLPEIEDELPSHQDQLSALDVSIGSAEDVLALPWVERGDAISFLETPELDRLLTLSDDPELRRLAVDQLERLGTPESLGVIGGVLENGDLDLQLYAVNAAERMLARL